MIILGVCAISKKESFSMTVEHDFSLPEFNVQEKFRIVHDNLQRRVESMIPFKPHYHKFIRKFRTGK